MEIRELRSLGSVIRARRKELGWTQEELAERISALDEYVRQSDISRIERDDIALPRRQRLARIAGALNLTLGELLALSGWAGADAHFANEADVPTAGAAGTPTDYADPLSRAAWSAPQTAPALKISELRHVLERFQNLSTTLQQRAQELSTARDALNETLRARPSRHQATGELDASA